MKRPLLFSSALCLILGILCGLILPTPWEQTPGTRSAAPPPARSVSGQEAPKPPASKPLNPKDNFALLNAAYLVTTALKDQDYNTLAAMVDAVKGVTLTPYSTVDPETDITLTPEQIRGLAKDGTVYTWGFVDGRGSLIELTIPQYFSRFVFDADYTQAPQIGVDKIIMEGNALENVTEAYPGCRFVDFCYPSLAPENQGLDWSSLKLVFEPGEYRWQLVGIVHSQWTV